MAMVSLANTLATCICYNNHKYITVAHHCPCSKQHLFTLSYSTLIPVCTFCFIWFIFKENLNLSAQYTCSICITDIITESSTTHSSTVEHELAPSVPSSSVPANTPAAELFLIRLRGQKKVQQPKTSVVRPPSTDIR